MNISTESGGESGLTWILRGRRNVCLFSPLATLGEKAIRMFYVEFEMSISTSPSFSVRLSSSLVDV